LVRLNEIIDYVTTVKENIPETFVNHPDGDCLHDSFILLDLQDFSDGLLDVKGRACCGEVGFFLVE